ncbi:hypothetical protein [Guyparkeria sp. SCN-R1]|uniref:hypothetical protein n=1 Tax=Guyparkeria sp. SCN-R1 TaxID=2341113 RepID=UPI001F02E747|nr:hypothetical protein [Guyparkeria sp. SCN-R1]
MDRPLHQQTHPAGLDRIDRCSGGLFRTGRIDDREAHALLGHERLDARAPADQHRFDQPGVGRVTRRLDDMHLVGPDHGRRGRRQGTRLLDQLIETADFIGGMLGHDLSLSVTM